MSAELSNVSTDRRVIRTRQVITEAFLNLISEQPFAKVNIKDITERADVNRSTFYSHFQDKYDLLNQLVQEHLYELQQLAEQHLQTQHLLESETADPYYTALFEHLAEHELFYKMMITRMSPELFLEPMRIVIRDSYYRFISRRTAASSTLVPQDILLDYMSYAIMGIIKQWFDTEMIYSPRYTALQLTRLSFAGTYTAMGQTRHA